MFERLEEFIQCLVWIHGFIEQCHELTADDGTGCVILRTGKGLLVADTETNHAWVAEVHAVDMVEVSELGIAEAALCAGDAGGADHIDEAIGMLIDEADALLAGFRSNHHDDTDIVLIGDRLNYLEIVIERKVGNNGSADSALYAALEELLDAIVHDGVEIAHEDEREADFILDGFELTEEGLDGHAVFQCLGTCALDNGSICQWVAEGDTYFYHIDTLAFHRLDYIAGTF